MRDFSFRTRKANLARMGSETWDVVVVGGGIVGAGIARDAALRGLKVALVERGDFASGTSGKTSRLVHGGLRYLRDFKVGLVRQAVRERDVLLRQAPTLVRPLAFTIPVYRGKGAGRITLRFGLFVYDLLSKDKVLPRRRWLHVDRMKDREGRLRTQSLAGGGLYYDALVNDARLVLAVVRAASEAGAVVANYAEAVECILVEGRVAGLRVRDRTDGSLYGVRASEVVNATGAWIDWLRGSRKGPPTVRPTKGIHVFVPREKIGNREAVVLTAKRDGRVIFVLPWNHLTLVGTTDTDYRGDVEQVLPDADDVAYLLESVNEAFPEANVAAADVVSAYAGVRPLIRRRGEAKESDISREHEIFEDADGLISVTGGKLTTHRAMAEEVVDRLCRRLAWTTPCGTEVATLGPSPDAARGFESMGFDPSSATRLGSRYAPDSFVRWLEEPRARDRIVLSLPYLYSEVCESVEAEMAVSLPDVMVRRLGLFYEATDQGLAAAESVARRMAEHLGWTEERLRAEVTAYRELVAEHRRYREGHGR